MLSLQIINRTLLLSLFVYHITENEVYSNSFRWQIHTRAKKQEGVVYTVVVVIIFVCHHIYIGIMAWINHEMSLQ